jgi:hypothetical protein
MASAKDIINLYLGTAESDPEEAKANIDELSRRIHLAVSIANARDTSTAAEVTGARTDSRRIFDS